MADETPDQMPEEFSGWGPPVAVRRSPATMLVPAGLGKLHVEPMLTAPELVRVLVPNGTGAAVPPEIAAAVAAATRRARAEYAAALNLKYFGIKAAKALKGFRTLAQSGRSAAKAIRRMGRFMVTISDLGRRNHRETLALQRLADPAGFARRQRADRYIRRQWRLHARAAGHNDITIPAEMRAHQGGR